MLAATVKYLEFVKIASSVSFICISEKIQSSKTCYIFLFNKGNLFLNELNLESFTYTNLKQNYSKHL